MMPEKVCPLTKLLCIESACAWWDAGQDIMDPACALRTLVGALYLLARAGAGLSLATQRPLVQQRGVDAQGEET
jgi:hypothetical protein